MPVDDPTVKAFCNESLRVIARKSGQLSNDIDGALAEWNGSAHLQATLAAGAGNVIDGSETDGRPVCTADQMLTAITEMATLKTTLDSIAAAMRALWPRRPGD